MNIKESDKLYLTSNLFYVNNKLYNYDNDKKLNIKVNTKNWHKYLSDYGWSKLEWGWKRRILMCSHTPCVLSPLGSLHYTCKTQTQATTTVDPQPPLQKKNDCSPHILNQQTNAIFVTDSKLSGVCDAIATPQKTTSLYNFKQSTHWARFGWNAFHQTVVMPCTGKDYLQSFILSVFGNTP